MTFYGRYGLGDSIWCDECGLKIEDVKGNPKDIEWQYNNLKTPLLYNWEKRGYRFKKYENYEKIFKQGGPNTSTNANVIRYSDVLLMRAEALIRKSNPDIVKAMGLINKVRERVGAFPYTKSYSVSQAFEILKRERHLELCGEQVRWKDLVRWGDAKDILNRELNEQYNVDELGNRLPDKIYFQDKHVLFPIPQSEKDVNPEVANDVLNDWN